MSQATMSETQIHQDDNERKKETRDRVIKVAILFLIAGFAYIGLFTAIWDRSPLSGLDTLTENYLEENRNKALVVFATARAINGIVSVIQTAEISVFVGSAGIGEFLDPANDLVEQFSSVMLVSLVSLAVQSVLFGVGKNIGLGPLLAIGIAALGIATLGKGTTFEKWFKAVGSVVLTVAIFLKLVIPLTAWVGTYVGEQFLDQEYETAIASLEDIEEMARDLGDSVLQPAEDSKGQSTVVTPQNTASSSEAVESPDSEDMEESGIFDQVRSMSSRAAGAIGDRVGETTASIAESFSSVTGWAGNAFGIQRIISLANDLAEKVVNLIMVFLIQTVLIPVFTAFLFWRLMQKII